MKKKLYLEPTCKWIAVQADVITSSLDGQDFYDAEQNPWESADSQSVFGA